ncbi:MAG: tyrosine recombinase XerC [Eubacteriales bacterium]|jgi:site-specific recombinase XerD
MNDTPLVITQFLSYKEVIQNRSSLTVIEYQRDLTMFFSYLLKSRGMDENSLSLVDGGFINSVTPEDIYSFLLYLSRQRKVSAKTMARKLSAIKAFFKYHSAKSRLVENNPAKDIDSPSIKQALPKFLSLEESVDLLEAVDKSDPFYARDYCILTLFLNCGMRLSELVGINLTDIDHDLKRLRVTGKGNKMRVIYLNSACRAAIESYLPVRSQMASKCSVPLSAESKNALFLSKRNQRISNKTVQWLVQKYLGKANLEGKGYSVHKLRHTAATLMYNQGGVDVRTLKEILGHEQLNTTQIYTHVSDKNLEKAMEANPLADIKKN